MCKFLTWCILGVISLPLLFLVYIYADSDCLHGRPFPTLDRWLLWSTLGFWSILLLISFYLSCFNKGVWQGKTAITFLLGSFCAIAVVIGAVAMTQDRGCEGVAFTDNLESAVSADGIHFITDHSETTLDDAFLYYYTLWKVCLGLIMFYGVVAAASGVTFVALCCKRTDEVFAREKRRGPEIVVVSSPPPYSEIDAKRPRRGVKTNLVNAL